MRYGDREARAFFHGLLPEGNARRVIAYDLGLAADDDFGLLAALGKDCAGALVIQPTGEKAPEPAAPPAAEVISDQEIGGRLSSRAKVPRLLLLIPWHSPSNTANVDS
jgi:serine/threonine-protein kinase HipA